MAISVQDFLKQNPNYIGYANTSNRTRPEEKKSKKGSGNQSWLSSIISEVAGAGGATGGAAAGAAIGAGFGGVGALPGAIIGGLLGGFGGGTAGRAVENKVRDNEYRLGDALKEGAVSGAFGAGGAAFQGLRGAQYLGKAGGGGIRAGVKGLSGLSDDAAKAVVLGGKKAGAAVGAGFSDDLFTAASKTAGKNTVQRTGNNMFRNTLGIDDIKSPLKSGPKTLFQADDMLKEAQRLGLKGTPKQMYRQVGTQYTRFNEQVAKELAKSTATTSYDDISREATKSVLKKMPASDKAFKVEFLNSLDELANMAKKGKLKAKDIHNFKNSLNVDSAFRKLSGDLSSPLTAKETVDMALWKEADNWISKLAPAAKELTSRQSKLYGLSQGLAKMTLTPGDPKSLMELATRIGAPSVRRTQGALGRTLTATGNLMPSVPEGASRIAGQVAKGTVARGALMPDFGESQDMMAPEDMQGYEQVDGGMMTPDALYGTQALQGNSMLSGALGAPEAPQEYNPYAPQNLQQSISEIMQQGGDMDDVKDFLSIAKVLDDLGGSGEQELTAIQRNKIAGYNTANTVVDSLEQLWQGVSQPGNQGLAGLSGLPGVKQARSTFDPSVRQYTQFAEGTLAPIIKSLGETGVLTDRDIIRAYGLVPNLQDSPDVAANKIQQLRALLTNAEMATAETGGGSQDALADILAAQQYAPY